MGSDYKVRILVKDGDLRQFWIILWKVVLDPLRPHYIQDQALRLRKITIQEPTIPLEQTPRTAGRVLIQEEYHYK